MLDLFTDPRFTEAVNEFNAGNYFEAHEIWEALWNDLIGPAREVCQGFVQIAAGYHKYSLGNVSGARKLLERGPRTVMTHPLDRSWVEAFVTHVGRDLDALKRGLPLCTPRPQLPFSA